MKDIFLCILADNRVNNYLTKEIYIGIIKQNQFKRVLGYGLSCRGDNRLRGLEIRQEVKYDGK